MSKRTRRGVVLLAVAGAFALSGATGTARAAKVDGPRVEWKAAMWGKPRAASAHMEAYSRLVKEATDGKFTIDVNYGGLAAEKEFLDGLKVNAFEMALAVAAYYPGKIPTWTVFELPFIPVKTLGQQNAVWSAYAGVPEVEQDFGKWNATYVVPNIIPTYELMGKGTPPKTLSDLNGRRLRAPGGMGRALAKLGAVPTSMPSSELYGSLERGLIDSAAVVAYFAYSFRLYELSTWYTQGLALGAAAGFVAVSSQAMDSLPAQYKKLLLDLRDQVTAEQIAAYNFEQERGEKAFRDKGIEFISFPKAERDKFVEIGGKPIWEEWVQDMDSKGIPGRKLLDFVLAEAEKQQDK